MPSSLEVEIAKLVKSHGDLHLVASDLQNRFHRGLLNDLEQRDYFQFLIDAGQLPLFFAEIQTILSVHPGAPPSAQLPWTQFVEALGLSEVTLDDFDIQALFDASASQDATSELVRSRRLDDVQSGFRSRREALQHLQVKARDDKKQALKDKLNYMRANRMFEQESIVLDELQAMFPAEADISAEREALDIRRAREIVANSTAGSAETDLTSELQWKADRLTPEQTTAKNLIIARASEIAADDSRLAYDLAVSLHMMDFNQEALAVLEHAEVSPAAEWLRLELMIRARQFVDALEESSRLEIAYAHVPDAAFAAIYARARAMHGLGQKALAIELLRSLVRIRPHYKSAHSLLRDWAGGEA